MSFLWIVKRGYISSLKTVVGSVGSFEIYDVDTELKIAAMLLIKEILVNTTNVCWTLFSRLHLIPRMQKWHTSRLDSIATSGQIWT